MSRCDTAPTVKIVAAIYDGTDGSVQLEEIAIAVQVIEQVQGIHGSESHAAIVQDIIKFGLDIGIDHLLQGQSVQMGIANSVLVISVGVWMIPGIHDGTNGDDSYVKDKYNFQTPAFISGILYLT